MKFTVVRFLKSLFIRLRLHLFFLPFTGFLQQVLWMTRLSKWANQNRKVVEFNDFPSKWDYSKRYKFYQYLIEKEQLNLSIDYLEFGVADGESFNWWMTQNQNSQSRFFGFDTFTGLPEDFGLYKKGTFNNRDNIPSIKDERGVFHQGLFQQTLPDFLKNFHSEKKMVVMLDADLFSSTLFVLGSLMPFLKKDDVIFFDEFVVPTHEFMAYRLFSDVWHCKLKFIGAANNYYFTAFKVG